MARWAWRRVPTLRGGVVAGNVLRLCPNDQCLADGDCAVSVEHYEGLHDGPRPGARRAHHYLRIRLDDDRGQLVGIYVFARVRIRDRSWRHALQNPLLVILGPPAHIAQAAHTTRTAILFSRGGFGFWAARQLDASAPRASRYPH